MKLTIEEDRERIKRYSHIQPAPRWMGPPCSVRCPGTQRSCSLKKGHSGPHVAHGMFRKVVAVWDARAAALSSAKKPRRAVGVSGEGVLRDGGRMATWKAFRAFLVRRFPPIEEVVFLVLGLAMVGFAIDWALRILGLR